ncbi:hypothetical protein D3C79_652940 [compost metagenome]
METLFFQVHLEVDGIQVFFSPADAARNAGFVQSAFDLGENLLDHLLTVTASGFHHFFDYTVAVRVQRLKTQLFQLGLQVVNTQAMGQGAVDFQGFTRDTPTFVRTQRTQGTHIVRAVGQLDQHDADILHHRHDHLAEVFRLSFFFILELQLVELGYAFNQFSDALAEQLFHILVGGRGVFDDVMQQRCHQRLMVETHFRQNAGHGDRVSNVGLTAGACLSLVSITCNEVCLFEALNLLLRQVTLNQQIQAFKQVQGRLAV